MCASINPGKKSAVPQVDDFRAGGTLDRTSHLDDAFALHQDLPRFDDAASLHIEQTRRMQHNWSGRGRLGLACGIYDESQRQKTDGCEKQAAGSHIARDGTTML